jgi:hypothetical protein
MSHGLRRRFPALRPLPALSAASSAVDPAAAAVSRSACETPQRDATHVAPDASTSYVPSTVRPVVRADLGGCRPESYLLYDVYKPGATVSRTKGHFPYAHCHVALSSGSPPSLAEQLAADGAAARAGAGEGGGAAGVVWAMVLNGDVAFFSLGHADLLPLML